MPAPNALPTTTITTAMHRPLLRFSGFTRTDHREHRTQARRRRMGATFRSFLEPTTDGQPDAGPHHPFRAAFVITVIGYALLTAAMIGIGLLLTHAFAGSVCNWDRHVSTHLA